MAAGKGECSIPTCASQIRTRPASAPSVQPDARFHFAHLERYVIHLEFKVSNVVLLNEEHFFR
jgi:hypothetical protein